MNSSPKPLLTAVIFTYNHASTIVQCIESHLEQVTDYPYEIHICDDCSTDGTSDICQKYADKYPNKIKYFLEEKNRYTGPYEETGSYKAMQRIDTKYFCMIDGDDYWCDKNKVQIALDFLENNPTYSGFAHDTLYNYKFQKKQCSYIHDEYGIKELKNPVEFAPDAPFFMVSSRIFRISNFKEKNIWPVDYMSYYYHFSKGPIYYHDKIMAVYNIGESNTFISMKNMLVDLSDMQPYRVSLLFDFTLDDFCTQMQKFRSKTNHSPKGRLLNLYLAKMIFGKKYGWKIWFYFAFVPKYGFECANINYVYPRKKAKKFADNKKITLLETRKHTEKLVEKKSKEKKRIEYLLQIKWLPQSLLRSLDASRKRKELRIEEYTDLIAELNVAMEGLENE